MYNNYYPSQATYHAPVQQISGLKGRPVASAQEAQAATIDFDGSIFFFPDLANQRIYTKQINLDGTALLNMYELKEMPIMEQPKVDTSNFVTRSEFEEVVNRLKNYLNSFQIEKTETAVVNPLVNPEPEKRHKELGW